MMMRSKPRRERPRETYTQVLGYVCALLGTAALVMGCPTLRPEEAIVTVTPTYARLYVGDTAALTARSTYQRETGFSFSSTNPEVASVTQSGVVTALQPGQATIVVSGLASGRTAFAVIDVIPRTGGEGEQEGEGEPPTSARVKVPKQHVDLGWMAVHDPRSPSFNGNCMDCHGARHPEYAAYGDLRAFHSAMREGMMGAFVGPGNAGCRKCHVEGADFLNRTTSMLKAAEFGPSGGRCATAACHGSEAPARLRFYVADQ